MSISSQLSKLIGTKMTGTFQLQMMLMDHATEEQVHAIQVKANHQYSEYLQRHRLPTVTPVFQIVRNGQGLDLQIHAGSSDPIATIKLSEENEMIKLMEPKPHKRRMKQQTKHPHLNSSLSLDELRAALSPYRDRLSEPTKVQLDQMYEQFAGYKDEVYCFDFDTSDEGVTIVAYRAFKRHAAITLFY